MVRERLLLWSLAAVNFTHIVDFMVKEDEGLYPFIPSGQSVKEMLEEPAP